MYFSRIIDEQLAGAGKRRVLIEKPIDQHVFLVKGIFKCSTEEKAREFANFLISFKGPAAYTLTAPAAPKKRGRPKKTEDNNNE